jgi:cysteine-rich secretory family protein
MGSSRARLAALATALTVLFVSPLTPAYAGGSTLQTLINQDRANNGGLAPLAWTDCLAAVAQQNAQRIAAQGFLSHTDGPELDLQCGVNATQAGENVAYISSGPDDNTVNTMYMNSPGHRANILGPYTFVATAWVTAPNGYGYNAEEFLNAPSLVGWPPTVNSSFYFAEGFTGGGFSETVSMLMPNQSGTGTIDYYTPAGHMGTIPQALSAGQVSVEDVLPDVGQNQEVSVRASLPGPGIVERIIHFNAGGWYGSTDLVGTPQPALEWDFAEGSTLPQFSEYLTLQNPNASPVPATLNYVTDQAGVHPTKTLTLPATSRTTVPVFAGNTAAVTNCDPSTTCGVGGSYGGVSVQVLASSPIIAERPFYVNGFSFGSGSIRDGHAAFGANGAAKQWYFAEGTTLPGFNEYLTLQNPGLLAANVSIRYMDTNGTVTNRNLTVSAQARSTVEVFNTTLGVGPGVSGVSAQVTSDQPIVAERPMYMVFNFGSGTVAGADDVVGATSVGTLYGFAAASTASGDNDYLTILNPSATAAAHLTITYYTAGGPIAKSVTVAANSRHTVEIINPAEGAGAGLSNLGIVVASDQPVLVEKPTYSANGSTYGATDTLGYAAAGF